MDYRHHTKVATDMGTRTATLDFRQAEPSNLLTIPTETTPMEVAWFQVNTHIGVIILIRATRTRGSATHQWAIMAIRQKLA